MSAAAKLDPAKDARLADLDEKLTRAHRVQIWAVKAHDALTALDLAVAADETRVQAHVTAARSHVRAIEVAAGKEIEKLKAEQTEVRGW